MTTEIEKLYGPSFPEVIDLERLKKRHPPLYEQREKVQLDGNTTAAVGSRVRASHGRTAWAAILGPSGQCPPSLS